MWWTLIAGAWATETPSFDAPAIELGAGLPLYTQRGAAQLSGRAIWGLTAAELNLSLDPNTDLRPTRIDGFSLDQDWAVKGIDVGYQRISLRARAELSRRSLGGAHQLHQGAGVDLLVKL